MADTYKEFLADDQTLRINEDVLGNAKQLSRYLMIKLGSSSLGYPFEMAKILRQCQSSVEAARLQAMEEVEQASFLAPKSKLTAANELAGELASDSRKPYALPRDAAGYAVLSARTSQWPAVIEKQHGIGSTALFIARRQGLLSLWNGLLPYWLHRVSFDVAKVVIEEAIDLNETLAELIETRVPVRGPVDLRSAVVPLLAQAVAGIALSPLELVQTRLAVQSVYPAEQAYSGAWSALRRIAREEGGLPGLYPHLLLTCAAKTLTPLLHIVPSMAFSQIWMSRMAQLDGLWSSVYFAGYFAVLTIAPLVTLPLETVRRRLMVGGAPALVTRVPVSPRRHSGFWSCLASVVREEGVWALYEGLGLALTNNVLLLALDLFTELEEGIPDDLEEF